MNNRYRTTDDILDLIDDFFSQLIDEHNLNDNQLERWRWDEPSTRLSWVGDDGIGRNMKAKVSNEDSFRVEVQVNAWKDIEKEEVESDENSDLPANFELRLWRHEIIGTTKPDPEDLQEIIQVAFPFVQNLEKDELNRQKVLS